MISTPAKQHIETWPIERLVEYPRNPRKNDKAVDRMCASIREHGLVGLPATSCLGERPHSVVQQQTVV